SNWGGIWWRRRRAKMGPILSVSGSKRRERSGFMARLEGERKRQRAEDLAVEVAGEQDAAVTHAGRMISYGAIRAEESRLIGTGRRGPVQARDHSNLRPDVLYSLFRREARAPGGPHENSHRLRDRPHLPATDAVAGGAERPSEP
ncbi:hypothetical protein ACIKTA_16235, partial [Hansschlegelia beijingensis]